MKGKLYLIPNTIGDVERTSVLPSGVMKTASELRYFIVESLRTARRFLRSVGYAGDFSDIEFFELNKHTKKRDIPAFLDPIFEGHDMGVISESGLPGVADPGQSVTAIAHKRHIQVLPLSGPSSIFMALMASGFNGQNFIFHGYLPINDMDRKRKLLQLEKSAGQFRQTQIFIETPYRNQKVFDAMLRVLAPETLLCVATEISTPHEFIRTRMIHDWRSKEVDIHKKNTVFLIYA